MWSASYVETFPFDAACQPTSKGPAGTLQQKLRVLVVDDTLLQVVISCSIAVRGVGVGISYSHTYKDPLAKRNLKVLGSLATKFKQCDFRKLRSRMLYSMSVWRE